MIFDVYFKGPRETFLLCHKVVLKLLVYNTCLWTNNLSYNADYKNIMVDDMACILYILSYL